MFSKSGMTRQLFDIVEKETKPMETLEQVEVRLKRWHTRLKRASTEIGKLERKRRRLLLGPKPKPKTVEIEKALPVAIPDEVPLPELDAYFKPEPKADDLSIPPFLKEREAPKVGWVFPEAKKKEIDPRTAKRLARNDEKRRGRSTTMPLSGKDALAYIDKGRRKKK